MFFNNTRFTTLDDFEKARDVISSYSIMIIFLIFLNFFWFGFFLATTPFPMKGNSSMLFTFLLSLDWKLVWWWRSFGIHFFLLLWSMLYYAHDIFFNSFLDLSFVGDNNFFNIVCSRFCHCLTPPSSSHFLFLLLIVAVCACGVVVEVALSLLLLSFM